MWFFPWWSLLACGGADAQPAQDYARAMAPLFERNDDLGQQFLGVASKLKQGGIDGVTIAEDFRRNAVPLARDLAGGAAGVRPDDAGLAAAHAQLVSAWQDRAEAYEAVAAASTAGDVAAFEAASRRAMAARAAELTYLDAVNAVTTPVGVHIDLYQGHEAAP